MIKIPELPYEIWKERINNEINQLRQKGLIDESTLEINDEMVSFELIINATGFTKDRTPGNTHLVPRKKHRAKIQINRQFPYAGGIEALWISSIFHPNLDPMEHVNFGGGTGYVCLNVLKKWSRLSDLSTSANALKMLVENPNPDDPLNYPECLEAAAYFKEHTMEELLGSIDDEEEDDDDDVVIIVDD